MTLKRKMLLIYLGAILLPFFLFLYLYTAGQRELREDVNRRLDTHLASERTSLEGKIEDRLVGLEPEGSLQELSDELEVIATFFPVAYRITPEGWGEPITGGSETIANQTDLRKIERTLTLQGGMVEVQVYLLESRNLKERFRDLPPHPGIDPLWFVGLFVGLHLVFLLLLVEYFLRPLGHLKHVAERIQSGHYDTPIQRRKKDEIGEVLGAFDEMQRTLAEAEEEKRRYEENRRELFANLSHDLKTPLTALGGYVAGLVDGVANTEEKRERYLKIIQRYTGDLERLLAELTTVTTLDVDHLPLELESIDVRAFVEDCAQELTFDLVERGIDFKVEVDPDLNAWILADRRQIRRVIDNVVDNAVKYRDKENAWLRLSVTETPDRVRLSIADNGAGIPEEKRHRIFDRFYRVDEARSSQIGGHGIGLAIAKSIVEAHGGRIWAESTEKVGTTVHLSLVKEGRDADTDR